MQQADSKTATTLKAIEIKAGMLPNLFTTLAHSSVALSGYIQLTETLAKGSLSTRQREMIAIALAQENACEYCLSAHVAIGTQAGLSNEEIESARNGTASTVLDNEITRFATELVKTRADISDEMLDSARKAGLSDELIIEIIANISLNVLTNYVNRIAGTSVDFPHVSLSKAT